MSAPSIADIFGGILGFALGPIFVNGDATVYDVKVFLAVNTICMILFALPTILFFREKPKYPASMLKITQAEHSPWEEFKKLIKIRNFNLLAINFAFMLTVLDLIALLIDPITEVVGYTGTEKVIIAIIFDFFGCIGLFIIKFMLD